MCAAGFGTYRRDPYRGFARGVRLRAFSESRVIQERLGHGHLKTSQLHREWRGPFPLRALFCVYSETLESRERADCSRGWPSL
jgi:hypothetical protein